jgi:hypothetical protein
LLALKINFDDLWNLSATSLTNIQNESNGIIDSWEEVLDTIQKKYKYRLEGVNRVLEDIKIISQNQNPIEVIDERANTLLLTLKTQTGTLHKFINDYYVIQVNAGKIFPNPRPTEASLPNIHLPFSFFFLHGVNNEIWNKYKTFEWDKEFTRYIKVSEDVEAPAFQKINAAMGTIDETIDEITLYMGSLTY